MHKDFKEKTDFILYYSRLAVSSQKKFNTVEMKNKIIMVCLCLLALTGARAEGKYSGMGQKTSNHSKLFGERDVPVYFGLRIGPAFAFVNSDDPMLNGGSMKTGVSFGGVVGLQLTSVAPVFVESGLTFVQKGGRGYVTMTDGSRAKFTFNLGYLQLPIVVKYSVDIDEHMSFQPFLGGYFALGLGGKVRNFKDRNTYGSFDNVDHSFRRFDAGLRFGCGFSFDLAYVELGYDFGLANIGRDDFDVTHNGCLFLNLGVNF